ncbi:tetratricopeptide repeat protein [Catellatospora bangladeshensis]|uniref:tetratricopeptide repeat protein n=1 Tax=Catellatospora bangladeshensis TaxID=310355 RepID=UPI0036140715
MGFLVAMGVSERPSHLEDASTLLRTSLHRKHVLLLLDNASDAVQVRPLLPAETRCTVIVTSRAPLAALAGAHLIRLNPLPPADAAAMLRPATSALPDASPQDVDRLAVACGNLPLALRIAASRLRERTDWTVTDLLRRLEDQHRRLGELRVGDLEVRASFAVSYAPQHPSVAHTFRLLGLLHGLDFSAATVAALTAKPLDEAAADLDRLTEAQLVEGRGGDRYGMHDLLRLFARERAEAQEDATHLAAAQSRVAQWHLQSASHWLSLAADGEQPDPGALQWFDAERLGLLGAVTDAFNAGQWEIVCDTTTAIRDLFRYRGLWEQGEQLCRTAVAAARRLGRPQAIAQALVELSSILNEMGRPDQTAASLREACELLAPAGPQPLLVGALTHLGEVYRHQGDTEQAMQVLQQACQHLDGIEDLHTHAWVHTHLGAAYFDTGSPQQALECYNLADGLYRQATGERWHWLGYYLAGAYAALERHDEAEHVLLESIQAQRQTGNLRSIAWFALTLARLLLELGRRPEAEHWYREALTIARQMRLRPYETEVLSELQAVTAGGRPDRRPMNAWPF